MRLEWRWAYCPAQNEMWLVRLNTVGRPGGFAMALVGGGFGRDGPGRGASNYDLHGRGAQGDMSQR
jgi:hypothetical protein